MDRPANLVVRTSQEPVIALSDLVLAWARDMDTGEPRYILELGEDRRGASCRCECASCKLPLTAVNAAREEFVRRPHFRHPSGAQKADCAVLAARVAVLHQLTADGWFSLPRRQVSGTALGLSGETYEALMESPPEKIRISDVSFRDRAAAILTFDDGRQLRVQLTGTTGGDSSQMEGSGASLPTIVLDVADVGIAAMSLDQIRQHLTLLPNCICWQRHWDDERLVEMARAAATADALRYLDEVPDGLELPAGIAPALKRESVLHFEVKKILQEGNGVLVPGLHLEVQVPAPNGTTLTAAWSCGSHRLALSNVALEHRLGRMVPDVICDGQAVDGAKLSPLLIEVTVTNHIDDERLGRIQDMGAAALEIDLSATCGRLTREQLRSMVLDELAIKRWLHYPELDFQRVRLNEQLAQELAELEAEIRDAANEYLDAVVALQDVRVAENEDVQGSSIRKDRQVFAEQRVSDAAGKLAIHGYPEASDHQLTGWHGILARILSIQFDRGVGYLGSAFEVLNAIRQVKGRELSNHTLYFIAARVYKPTLTQSQAAWLAAWTNEVKVSIKAGEEAFQRDSKYDRMLSLLFPDMADALSKPFGKRRASTVVEVAVRAAQDNPSASDAMSPDPRRTASLNKPRPRNAPPQGALLDTPLEAGWLRGRDLEAWKKQHPEAAARHFRST